MAGQDQQPVQFSTSLQHTTQYRYDYFTGLADKSQSFEISGSDTLGLAKRLRVPDDFFQLSQSISFQYYNLEQLLHGAYLLLEMERQTILAYTVSLV